MKTSIPELIASIGRFGVQIQLLCYGAEKASMNDLQPYCQELQQIADNLALFNQFIQILAKESNQ